MLHSSTETAAGSPLEIVCPRNGNEPSQPSHREKGLSEAFDRESPKKAKQAKPSPPKAMPFPLAPVRFWTHEPVADTATVMNATASSTARGLIQNDVGQLCDTKPPNRAILFLHIYKTGGTSNRQLFQHWAEACGMSYAQCGSCPEGSWMTKLPENNTQYICLHGAGTHRFPTPRNSQRDTLPLVDVVAGHMAYGFHKHIQKKYTYITCLRNPMARFVSSILYEHRAFTSNMTRMAVIDFVSMKISSPRENHTSPYRGIYPAKLSGKMMEFAQRTQQTNQEEADAVALSIAHLHNGFAVVGILEAYPVFIELTAGLLDPKRKHDALWTDAKMVQANPHAGIDQGDVMPHLSDDVMALLNEIVSLDWPVYIEGCRVGYAQCVAAVSNGNKYLERTQCDSQMDICNGDRWASNNTNTTIL